MSGSIQASTRLLRCFRSTRSSHFVEAQRRSYQQSHQPTITSFLPTQSLDRTRFPLRTPWVRPLRVRGSRRYGTDKSDLEAAREKAREKTESASQRFKELSRKYGWAAVGVYLGLSALDFPFCFLAVRMLGPERVGEAEHYVVSGFWNIVGKVVPSMAPKLEEKATEVADANPSDPTPATVAGASIWTQLLLAYGVHKSLIFFRVPLTAAITPKIVKYLRARGWNIGNPKVS